MTSTSEPAANARRYAIVCRNGITMSFFLILRRPMVAIMSKTLFVGVQTEKFEMGESRIQILKVESAHWTLPFQTFHIVR